MKRAYGRAKLQFKVNVSSFLAITSAAVAAFWLLPAPAAVADCITGGSTATCIDDIDGTISYTFDTDGITTIRIDGLTSTLSGADTVELVDATGAGGELTVELFDSDFGISATDTAIEMLSIGSGGSDGSDGEPDGDDGDDGTDGGALEVLFDGAIDVESSGSGIILETIGGAGGDGGEGESFGTDRGRGGDGGDGGDANEVTIDFLNSDSNSTITVDGDGPGIYVSATAGQGGDGGFGVSSLGEGRGETGGDGGSALNVIFANDSATDSTIKITTTGDDAYGIGAESIAGSGGDGGGSTGLTARGGTGGDGGSGGETQLYLQSTTISTEGDGALGILLRSYGGAGGDGGDAAGETSSTDGDTGAGGAGGDVTLEYSGTIETSGDDATGVLIQSVGGYAGDENTSTGAFVTYGADIGSGGDGGTVSVTFSSGSEVEVTGDDSSALAIQSIGGGGGDASNLSSVISSIGGDGGGGGDGGTVSVDLTDGDFITEGENAPAVSILSVGGGGGSSGSSSAISSVGGSGGDGGDGGKITVTTSSSVATESDYSDAFYLSSIGGGGGSAYSTSGISAIGGSGGDGGKGKKVKITLSLDDNLVLARGYQSDAVFAQSIGGGGGSGASAVSVGVDYASAVGGSGGDGGNGGKVVIKDGSSDFYTIKTFGDHSAAVTAQSVGGGGGDGGNDLTVSAGVVIDVSLGMSGGGGNGSDGNNVTVDLSGTLETEGDVSPGLFAQSVGSGGGSAGTDIDYSESSLGDITIATGGSGGEAGDGGKVTVTSSGDISTEGELSTAITAQSIGGGGGNSATTVAGSVASVGTFTKTLGGDGGKGGDGGTVAVTNGGDIDTSGSDSHGIFALSLGGGGGSSGWTSSIDGFSNLAVDVSVGGSGSDGGSGATVDVTSTADIDVEGDNSAGIKAQSIGGDGGSSGITVSGEITSGGDVSVAVGGDGGASGEAGDVTVTSSGDKILTDGENGFGILAQSVSNTGGSSGVTFSGDLVSAGDVAFSTDGSGGDGGNSGSVEVDNSSEVKTLGSNAKGIFAQSVAGGGGSSTGSITSAGVSMTSFSYSLGGNGGEGGTAGDVSIDNTGIVKTQGVNATGIYAQSLGGAGGDGGYSINGSLTAGEYSGDVSVSLGGDSGSGNTGGDVTITNSGDITTQEYAARGIFAQSMGGSGGSGGSTYSGILTVSTGAGVDVNVAVGGDGGDGGLGGDVTVTNEGDISTDRFYADAVYAQSIGGDGGTGGGAYTFVGDFGTESDVSVDISVGGDGGEGAIGGDVQINNTGSLTTEYASSSGIYAQSVGGNGGTGGSAGTILLDLTNQGDSSSASASVATSVGGTGGSGGDAGSVDVQNLASIVTEGKGSRGIYAQSVGGGGGDGGLASAFNFSFVLTGSEVEEFDVNLDLAIGGSGGAGGDGNAVTINNTSSIETSGNVAYGIFGQSIGGGGGNGGDGDLDWTAFTGTTTETGDSLDDSDFANAAYASEVGTLDAIDWIASVASVVAVVAEPSNIITSWEVAIGGSGGASGDGDDVSIFNSGEITTTGTSATGIFAQSVGGGGGSGGDATGDLLSQVNVGGQGSGGGDGGDIEIVNDSTITTSGYGAMGMFAQTVGGGGGAAGDVELAFQDFLDDTSSFGVGVIVQEDAGDGGDGGSIEITSGAITTSGELAHAIWAQSVGGSGGAVGVSATDLETLVGSAGDQGNAGDITITASDALTLSGDYAVGIFAQSASGDDDDDTSGDITITLEDDVTSSGTGGRALFLQSVASSSSNNGTIAITIDSGVTVSTEEDGYDTILLDGGSNNKITNYGTISKDEGDSVTSYVIAASDANLDILNYGTISGSLSLDGPLNQFTNETDGTFEMGQTVDLGSLGTFTNQGTISAGSVGSIATSTVTLNTFTSSGIYKADLELGSSSDDASADLLDISGIAIVDDVIEPNLVGTNLLSSGDTGSVTILSATSLASGATVSDTAIVDYTLSTDGDDLVLSYDVDYSAFSSSDLDTNSVSVGDYISTLVGTSVGDTSVSASSASAPAADSGAAGAAPAGNVELVVEVDEASASSASSAAAAQASAPDDAAYLNDLATLLLSVDDAKDLQTIYNTLGPGEVFAPSDSSFFSSLRFVEQLQGCPLLSEQRNVIWGLQGSCVWLSFDAGAVNKGPNDNTTNYDETHYGGSFGGQLSLGDGYVVGAAFNYEDVNLSNDFFTGDGFRVQGGVSLQKQIGQSRIIANLSGGRGSFDLDRTVFTPSGTKIATSRPVTNWVAGHIQGQHRFDVASIGEGEGDVLYLKPSLDLGIDYQWQGDYSESGANEYSLLVDSFNNTAVTLNPLLEVGGDFEIFGIQTNASVSAGLLAVVAGRDRSTNASFVGAGSNGPTFLLSDQGNAYFADVGASLQAVAHDQSLITLNFDTLQTTGRQEYVGTARASFLF